MSDQQLLICVKEKAERGNYLAAIAYLNQLIGRHQDSAVHYNNRGLMYFCAGQNFKALQDYNRAIAIDPKLDRVYNNRANCYAAQGNLGAALADYETALDLNPANLRTWINQGLIFRKLGLYDLAIENFDLALVLGVGLKGRIYAERGYTYYLRGDWNCAIADYYRALDRLTMADTYREKVSTWIAQLLLQEVEE